MPRAAASSTSLRIPLIAELISRGDGTFVYKPRISLIDGASWITPREAAKILGVQLQSVYELCHAESPFLVSRRPLLRKIVISLKSVESLRRLTVNPDFWQSKRLMDTRLAET